MLENYNVETYGERIAHIYDDWYPLPEAPSIDLLCELSRNGRALELGIGTGRVALPLRERGTRISGVDASPAMVEKLRRKPGGTDIPVTIGDFSEVPVEGSFELIYVLFNTFFALMTQDLQQQCLRNVARHLSKTGVFLIEVFVPDLGRFDRGQTVRVVDVRDNAVRLEASRHDAAAQQVVSQHVLLTEQGIRLYPVTVRYVWPAELDIMARTAGMELANRWCDWARTPFHANSGRHISVYRPRQDPPLP